MCLGLLLESVFVMQKHCADPFLGIGRIVGISLTGGSGLPCRWPKELFPNSQDRTPAHVYGAQSTSLSI
jgi:hypothetical protein